MVYSLAILKIAKAFRKIAMHRTNHLAVKCKRYV